ncbi:MAG: VWA domain-containing protein, partial [Thermogemmata sp.]|nr:VWA domain-containing protein [Thermogemmata sp.]
EELAASKFSRLPLVTYQPRDGELIFAWQVRPQLEAMPARPRDVVFLVDTTASQAGIPLRQARAIIEAVGNILKETDRVSVWTLNTPEATRPLTRGFFAPNSKEVRDAAAELTELEYGSGAADLKGALLQVAATFSPNPARTQAIVLLGDGESVYQPLSEADRLAIGNRLDSLDILFFAVPLGLKVNAANLHGLAVLTGGAVVRVQEDLRALSKKEEFARRLVAALDVPVLKVEKFRFGEEVGEVYPTRLPPLRTDRGTLVLGRLARPVAERIHLHVEGYVARRAVQQDLNVALTPSQPDHYFLNLMLEQWRNAPHKEAPALLQSDRALALASTQVQLYREEFLTQAVWAINLERYEEAEKLFQAVQRLRPQDGEAQAGLRLLAQLKSGQLTPQDLKRRISDRVEALKITPHAAVREVIHLAQEQQPPAAVNSQQGGGAQPGGTAQVPRSEPTPQQLLAQQQAERKIAEDQARMRVQTAIRDARERLRSDPEGVLADLKRLQEEIDRNAVLGEAARRQILADLNAAIVDVYRKGEEIKRQAAVERDLVARARQRLNALEERIRDENRIQFRIDQFRQLMQQARYELAYQEAQLMIAERTNAGQPVPVTATASYIIGQHATQLREWKELVRIREDRFLIALMQTEKSHIPYPDEPPVHFPPAAVWRELTSLRREAYLHSNLGPNPPASQIELKNKIENDEVRLRDDININDQSLSDLLDMLGKQHGINFIIMEEHFKAEGVTDIKDKRPNLKATSLRGMKLGNFLDIVLQSMGATFIVRPDYVEITTFNRRLEEKVTRVFPVADLVIPIPSAVNQQMLFMNLFFQNSALAIYGAVLGSQTFQGFGGAFGNPFQGQQFGAPGQPFGGGLAMQGAQQFGPDPFGQNLGFGGGGLQIGGGNLGQFGNLGGQFGLQGGDQSRLLMELIVETVARGEWLQVRRGPAGQVDEDAPILDQKQLNSLGYYPPARALLVRGTHRYHPASSVKLKRADGGQVLGPNPARNGAVAAGNGNNLPAGGANASSPASDPKAVAAERPRVTDPRYDPAVLKPKLSKDPRRMWNQAVEWTVEDPGLIVASAEFLMEQEEYQAAAEILKAGLRKGLTTETWTHDALAIALQLSQASAEEVLRAGLSAADLEPQEPRTLLQAAQALADARKYDVAIAFCKRAAQVAPQEPLAYANALAYAQQARQLDTDAVLWAGRQLLRQDWGVQDRDYHQEAKRRLEALLAQTPAGDPRREQLAQLLKEQTQRDLVIELLWQGPADLDLIVEEPCGSVCSPIQPRSVGGGILRGDRLEQSPDGDRSEIYLAASAFSGTYRIRVRTAFGQPVGQRATLKVTRYQGTPRQTVSLHEVDLNRQEPVVINLERGSRTALADVTIVTDTPRPVLPTQLTARGFAAAAGRPGVLTPTTVSTGSQAHLASPTIEKRLGRMGTADFRGVMQYDAQRGALRFHVNPVFTSAAEVTLPPLSLLPGSRDLDG